MGDGIKMSTPKMVTLADINEAPYNPRIMPAPQMAALKASLRKHGFVLSLVIRQSGMELVGGHQRLRAVREVCKEDGVPLPIKVPAVVLDIDDAQARQLNVALNRIEGEFDASRLGDLFASIRGDMTLDDILATGFSSAEIDEAILLASPLDDQVARLEEEAAGEITSFASAITLTVEFADATERDVAKDLLRSMALAAGKKAGAVLLDALKARQTSRVRQGIGETNGKQAKRGNGREAKRIAARAE